MEEIIFSLISLEDKPKLLLHICCGPCSSAVIERLADFFNITLFYYNPNIYPEKEYIRRRDELFTFTKKFPKANNIHIIEENYSPDDFYTALQLKDNPELATEKEMGERCKRCYELRLKKTFEYAEKNCYDYVTTSLSISPYKDAIKINHIGSELEKKHTVKFLYSDFKKKNGFLRSLEFSKEYNMYRQDYCGCIYSLNNISKREKNERNKKH